MTNPYSEKTHSSLSSHNDRQSTQPLARNRFPDLDAPSLGGVGLEEDQRPCFRLPLSADSVVGYSTSYNLSPRYRSGRIQGCIFSSAHDGITKASRTTISSNALREREAVLADNNEGGIPE